MSFSSINLLLHAAITFAMTGIIWFVHLIHYPVMNALTWQREVFEKIHWQKTMKIAVIMLILELGTGIVFVLFHPVNIPSSLPISGLWLIVLIWITTWWLCVPSHCQLKQKYSENSIQNLMKANKWRAVLWSLRSAIIAYSLFIILHV